MPTQTPVVGTFESRLDRPLAAEPRLVELRSQAAIVRTLVDQVEQLTRAAGVEALGAQLVEEVARLGCGPLDWPEPRVEMLDAFNSGWADFEGRELRRGRIRFDDVAAELVAKKRG